MTITEAKQIPLKDLLAIWGFHPVKETKDYYLYYSVFQKDKVPLFYVFKSTNTWKDFGKNLEGHTINLVMELYQYDAFKAIKLLTTMKNTSHKKDSLFELHNENWREMLQQTRITKIKTQSLITYLTLQLGLLPRIWKSHPNLYELDYQSKDLEGVWRTFSTIAWLTDIGSYDLHILETKNVSFGPTHITTIFGDTADINVFDHFFNYLSALQYFDVPKFRNTTIILNSLHNTPKIDEILKSAEIVNLFLNNSEFEGKEVAITIKSRASPNQSIINRSLQIHPKHENFNDFLLETNIKKN